LSHTPKGTRPGQKGSDERGNHKKKSSDSKHEKVRSCRPKAFGRGDRARVDFSFRKIRTNFGWEEGEAE